MKRTCRKAWVSALLLFSTLLLTGCSAGIRNDSSGNIQGIAIDGVDFGITISGDNVSEESVFTSTDIIYYEDLTEYPSGSPYGEGEAHERHSAEEAAAHTVVNITRPGTYRISGTMEKGQIRVDLGEDAAADPEAAVTLVLDGLDINCEVAPAILFLNVYECDGRWTAETASSDVDTSAAGANLVIADGSVNNVNGGHVAKIFEDGSDEEKLWKQDGAIYSYMSMNVSGEEAGDGVLNLTADNEGLDSELHLTINSGNLNIFSDNDGINTNEDGVSVTTINGGNVHILAGLGAEGDGIDSNGWLVINGGTVIASANPAADAGLDSDMGSYVNGGTVIAFGSSMDWAESDSRQVTMNLQFAGAKEADSILEIRDAKTGEAVFTFDPATDPVLAEKLRSFSGVILSSPDLVQGGTYHVFVNGIQQSFTGTDVMLRPGGFGGQGGMTPGGEPPEGMEPPQGMQPPQGGQPGQMPEGMEPPEGMGLPEGMEPPEGFSPGQRPERPEGFEPPEDMQLPQTGVIVETGNPQTGFYMQDKVNAFSGITDHTK